MPHYSNEVIKSETDGIANITTEYLLSFRSVVVESPRTGKNAFIHTVLEEIERLHRQLVVDINTNRADLN